MMLMGVASFGGDDMFYIQVVLMVTELGWLQLVYLKQEMLGIISQ